MTGAPEDEPADDGADSFAAPTPDPWVDPSWPDLEPAF